MTTEDTTDLGDQSRRIEIELQFRDNLVAALDRLGYRVQNVKSADDQERASMREKYQNKCGRTSVLWTVFFVHSKDDAAAFCLSVWFSNHEPTPQSFKWRSLGVDGLSVAGPSRRKIRDGVSRRDDTPPLCYHLVLVDARLGFEPQPLSDLRDTLLGGGLAEELASKIALAFERISAIGVGGERR